MQGRHAILQTTASFERVVLLRLEVSGTNQHGSAKRVSAFVETGRSNVCFREVVTGCYRPEAVVPIHALFATEIQTE